MGAEMVAAVLIGVLAMGVLLAPVIWPGAGTRQGGSPIAPPELEDTARGQALIALKEIDFDRATGKLSEADYEELKARYAARAMALLEEAPGAGCAGCGAKLVEGARFCEICGGVVG